MADLKTTNIYGDAYINNKVGIATNAPATRLQIGQLSPTAATEGIQFGDDTNTRIYRGASGQINFNGTINVLGNTYLGDANGDTVFVNDTIRIGATDSGDASLFFGEGSVAGSDYGARWYWDSGYTFTWYTRNAGTDTALFDYVTNDTNYINWRRHFHMQNKEINYNAQIHFNAGTRFVGNNTSYLNFRSDSAGAGGILVQDGNATTKGYTGYWDSAGGGILNNSGNWAVRYNFGNANSGGQLYGDWSAANFTATTFTGALNGNANAVSFTEVELNAPVTVSGTWTTGNGSEWGEPKFGTSFNQYRYADNDGPYVEYNIPANHHACFISQLQWSSGGYADCHGVQADGDLVFLRRINTRQLVENSNHGNTVQHDGATVTFVGSGLQAFSKIRITNRGGRIHLTGIAFTRQIDDGYEGTGMVHPAQISHQGAGSGLDADLLDGYSSATANTVNTIVLRDGSGNFSAGTITATLSGNATTATSINGFGNPTTNSTANTIVYREGNGYITNNYFYTSGGGSERNASGMAYFAGFNSSDYYIRSYTAAAVATLISGQTMNINGSSTSAGCVNSDTGNVGDSRLQYWQTSGNTALNPDGEWYNAIRMGHGNPVTYYSNTLAVRMTGGNLGDIYTRTTTNGATGSWNRFWHNNNDGAGSGLDADLVDGKGLAIAGTADTIVLRDSSGHITGQYILGSYFNASAGNSENPTIGQIWTQNTTDNYLRKSTPAHFRSQVTDGSYPSLTGANASGTWSISVTGNAATATSADNIDGRPFVNTNSNSATNADTINSNGISYYTSGVTNFSGNATDGALHSQAYSNDWQHQIAGDYRSGQIALRGKNGGTWQSWRRVLDETNSPYALNMNQYVRTSDAPTFAGSTNNGTISIFPSYVSPYSSFLRMGYDNSGNYEYTIKRDGTTGFLEFYNTQANYTGYYFRINGSGGGLGIAVSPASRLHVNGDGTNPAVRVDNTGVVLAASVGSNGRTFYGWLPISVDGTTRWIRIFS